jgi:hypothetical protein
LILAWASSTTFAISSWSFTRPGLASSCWAATPYDGVLQLGVPPRRIDIINRADGITFAEAVADGESFELDGCAIPVIGRDALLKNKRAAGRPQDVADVKALDSE